MKWNLFIDDERNPETIYLLGEYWTIARSSEQATNLVKEKGMPDAISFDHDLGENDTSIVFLKWLIEYALENKINWVPECFFHTQNPVGKQNLKSLVSSWLRIIKQQAIMEEI